MKCAASFAALAPVIFAVSLASAVTGAAPSIANTVYIIRHGEKPADGGQGLSQAGEERAQCLTNVFGPSSGYNIGYILAEQPESNGDRTRPLLTVTPLAKELGLTVDTSCDRDDSDCVATAVAAFAASSSANVLICWEHKALRDVAQALGVADAPKYPKDSFNIIWTVQDQTLVNQTSEDCPGLDD
ncbi:putative phosphoglycerate mutase family protein [Phellopilus nigrolimitatus]|nr:putative phosphoglycerate mutase family protein [Phellopilus nigrolimitatus]